MSDVLVTSLRSRIRAMNTLWERAVSDMTLEQINHHERAGILPVAFSLSHFMRGQDQAVSRYFLIGPTLWESGGWAKRVGVTVDRFGRGASVQEMEQLRLGDISAWREYQGAVIARTEGVLETINEGTLAEVVLPVIPPEMRNGYIYLMVGPDRPVSKLDALECFIYQHGLRHLGELDHARALAGLGEVT